MKTIYKYDPAKEGSYQEMFRTGLAVAIDIDQWYLEAKDKEPRFMLSSHLTFAMHHLRIFDLLLDLPIDSSVEPFDAYEETTLLSDGLPLASQRLRDYAEGLAPDHMREVKWQANADTEYQITIDFGRLKAELFQLVEFINETAKTPKKSIEWWL